MTCPGDELVAFIKKFLAFPGAGIQLYYNRRDGDGCEELIIDETTSVTNIGDIVIVVQEGEPGAIAFNARCFVDAEVVEVETNNTE